MESFAFQDSFDRIKGETDIKKFTQLAEFIGVSQPAISKAKKRNVFPPEWAIAIEQKYGLLTRWILTGEGPMRHNQKETSWATPSPATPPTANTDLPTFILELNTWAREISEPPGNLRWLEKQLETCLPTWKTWREAKDEEAKKTTTLPTDKVA